MIPSVKPVLDADIDIFVIFNSEVGFGHWLRGLVDSMGCFQRSLLLPSMWFTAIDKRLKIIQMERKNTLVLIAQLGMMMESERGDFEGRT